MSLSVCPSACLSVCLFVCLSVYLSNCLSNCLSVCLTVCLSNCLTVYCCLFVYLTACLSNCLSVCLTVCLFVCLSVCLFVCLSVCLSVCLFVCLSNCLSALTAFQMQDWIIMFSVASFVHLDRKSPIYVIKRISKAFLCLIFSTSVQPKHQCICSKFHNALVKLDECRLLRSQWRFPRLQNPLS